MFDADDFEKLIRAAIAAAFVLGLFVAGIIALLVILL